ncbi:MAG TPA: TetR/AcrR family transcriptional regulator [Polyangiaceae bacterium]|nr:TetR/AcrR family transcriptional regulator [Polyangiaceae bacterium]
MGRTKTIDDEEILNHARSVFREGSHAASTRDIARAAGISQAVLYQRFGSKEELFFRAMAPEPPDIEALLGPYPPRSVHTDLKRIGERVAAYVSELVPTLLHVLAAPGTHAKLVHMHQRLAFHPLLAALTERFARMREDGLVSAADPSATARAFLAIAHVAALGSVMGHSAHGNDFERLLEVLWQGLAPKTASKPARREPKPR